MPKTIKEYLNSHNWLELTMNSFIRKSHKVFKTSSSSIKDILIDHQMISTFDEIREKLAKSFEARKEDVVNLAFFINNIKDFSASSISALVSPLN